MISITRTSYNHIRYTKTKALPLSRQEVDLFLFLKNVGHTNQQYVSFNVH
jgi:hypothetical protein